MNVRPMQVDDVALLERWDRDPDVAAAIDGAITDWYDWPVELARDVPWRELLIATDRGRPVGFVQLTDAAEEETHHWGEIEPGTWALDIVIGSPADRGRGFGTQFMRTAIARIFDTHGAHTIVIDPLVTNTRAIEFYRRLGFTDVGERTFGDDCCLVMRLDGTDSSTVSERDEL